MYDGEWKNGIMNGMARYTYPDGMIFQGYFADNKKSGKGSYNFPDGSFYQGELLEGYQKHGFVIDEPVDGCHYVGHLEKGQRHGLGIYIYPSDGDDMCDKDHIASTCSFESKRENPACDDCASVGVDLKSYGFRDDSMSQLVLDSELHDDEYSWISQRDVYKGEWKFGVRHGRGEYVKRGCYIYTGSTRDINYINRF